MGLFDFAFSKKSKPVAGDPNQPGGIGQFVGNGSYGEGDTSFAAILANGGLLTPNGSSQSPAVTEYTAVTLSAFWACVRVIAESVALMPIQVLERSSAGVRRDAREHPAYRLLNKRANPRQVAFNFREIMTATMCLWGNAYAIIERDKFMNPIGLHWVHPRNVSPLEYQGDLFYYITGEAVPRQSWEMLHYAGLGFNGVTGYSVLSVMRDNIGLGLSAQNYGRNFYDNGANVAGVLETDAIIRDEGVLARLRANFEAIAAGQNNSHKTIVLEQGLKYKRIGMPPADAQFIETRKVQADEIARFFRVPPHKIGILERSTNNNIEHQGLEFVTDTLGPWLARIEQENSDKLLREDQKALWDIKHNYDGLLRGDVTARGTYYQKLWQMGAISANDIMDMEDRPHVENGDARFVPINYQPVDRALNPPEPVAAPATPAPAAIPDPAAK